MVKPFDQIYPELVENEQVAYDDQTLLLKLPLSMGSEVTEEMSAAGVGELEQLFAVETAAWYEAKLVLGTDVPAGSFYHIPVLWAVEKGVTNGLSATEFGPNAICNRAQIVTFLYRAFA